MNLNVTCFGATQFYLSLMGVIWFWLHPEELARPVAANLMAVVSLTFSVLIMYGGYLDSTDSLKVANKKEAIE